MLNPLHKLKRFSNAAPKASNDPTPKPAPQETVGNTPKPPAPKPLTEAELLKMVDPKAFVCLHCTYRWDKTKPERQIQYMKSPNHTGWFCVECLGHFFRHGRMPDKQPIRIVPKLVKPCPIPTSKK